MFEKGEYDQEMSNRRLQTNQRSCEEEVLTAFCNNLKFLTHF